MKVVAGMAYLHRHLGRGWWSHSCTNFCFLCGIYANNCQEGYPGGGVSNVVEREYSIWPKTGCQKCRDYIFWNGRQRGFSTLRKLSWGESLSVQDCYETMDGLKAECFKRCTHPHGCVLLQWARWKSWHCCGSGWRCGASVRNVNIDVHVFVLKCSSFYNCAEGCDLSC